ncbi:hypothetical protein TraAM80_00881 [Trypanosoma rangeli]|uniref:SB domain-containing protein n=1 Tax=Trypanosoma rangeli TaxID=5698 RepID=A0A422P1F9_TRYRA|nr:uncharacterized protein TraAM80_00881 [Trypanosoma rangeli]RNF11548.1 hypothetical protein TraAM80_00881 [Trypanosoma rangeli]|eukprot:RNF11548.1 hypothetical protein TraAM80_00881 [Trypanosoma rangeli]
MKTSSDSRLSPMDKWYRELLYCTKPANLSDVYGRKDAAKAVARHLHDYLPHAMDHPASLCFLKKGNNCVVTVNFLLSVVPDSGTVPVSVDVGILFPQTFPKGPLKCRVRVRGAEINFAEGIFSDGVEVHLSELAFLKVKPSPYPLVDVVKAISHEIRGNLKFFTTDASFQHQCQGTSGSEDLDGPAILQKCIVSRSPVVLRPGKGQTEKLLQHASMEDSRMKTLRWASELLFARQIFYAEPYLSFREESVPLLRKLYASREIKMQEQHVLKGLISQLREASVRVASHEQAITSLQRGVDASEDSSTCIVPVDDLQARALELLSEVYALDDVLELLERSLKAGQLSCEEYVRRVSDIGRKQFEARFLFARVAEAVK